jgi:solute carrier family 35 protein F1/2
MSSFVDIRQDPFSFDLGNLRAEPADADARPLIVYSSPSMFVSSLWSRFFSLWTRRFTLSLLAGQVVSLCVTCTDVTTTELVRRHWFLPTTQTFFLWVLI